MTKEKMSQFSDPQVMAPRKPQTKTPQSLPKEFIKTIGDLFNKQFATAKGEAEFLVYGGLYPNEALLCVCLAQVNRPSAVSFYCSADLAKDVGANPEKVTEVLKSMMDLMASWFAQSFKENAAAKSGLEAALTAMEDMDRNWQSVKWEKRELFVKLTRENQLLESAATKWLKDSETH